MEIKTIALSGYKRFKLSGIEKLLLSATSPLQLILGTNGSGKSSLLEALSPYPQPVSDYNQNGYKELNIEHNTDSFQLTSKYKKTAKHSFIKNGKELNPGGTSVVQKRLVERELGFDSDLHNLVTGQIKYTTMSPLQRREWVTKISPLDLDYAINLHKQVKTKLRDTQGTLRLSEDRLANETKLLLDKNSLDDLKATSSLLNEQITFHLTNKNKKISRTDEGTLDRLSNEIIEYSDNVLNLDFKPDPKYNFKCYKDIISKDQALQNDIDVKRKLISEYEEMLFETEETIRQLKDEGAINLNGLENKLSTLYEAMSKVDTRSDRFTIEGDLRAVVDDTRSLRVTLSHLVAELTGDKLKLPDVKLWDSHRVKLKDMEIDMFKNKERLATLSTQARNMANAKVNTCPKCKYTWREGISEKEYETIKKIIDDLKDQIKRDETAMEKQSELVSNIAIRKREYQKISNLASSYPRLRTLWNYINDSRYTNIDEHPTDILEAYEQWSEAVECAERLSHLKEEVDTVECTIKRIKSVGDHADINLFTKKQQELKDKVCGLHNTLDGLRQEHDLIKKYKEKYNIYDKNIIMVINKMNEYNKAQVDILEKLVQEFNDESLKNANINLSSVVEKLNEAETAAGVVDDLNRYIEQLRSDLLGLKALEAALSPSEGLIADSMTNFIESFTSQLNNVVSEVWDYDMRILPCRSKDGSLDYKFPLEVPEADQVCPDISDGSKGQKEIIDFAFMLAVMVYMDLKDYPLVLDELGSPFDETHRKKLIHFIKWLLDAKQCSQIWMISHFAADHGGLSNAEVCVLNTANIAVPEKYNTHVSIN